VFRLDREVSLEQGEFPLARQEHGITIQTAGGQMVLVAVLENGWWGEDELAPSWGVCST
jgi:hypothetical protein